MSSSWVPCSAMRPCGSAPRDTATTRNQRRSTTHKNRREVEPLQAAAPGALQTAAPIDRRVSRPDLTRTLIDMADLRPLVIRREIERQVRERFPREIAACDDLLAVAWRMLGADPWTGRPMTDAPADRLIISEAARGLKTYRASIDAALGGFGPQSAMLDRTLFEGMAVAYWVRANPELAAERFEQHSRHLRGIWKKRLLAQAMDAEVQDVPDEEEQRKLDRLFGPWGDKLWCGLPMHEVIAAIEDQWEEGDRRNELKGFFRIAHANNVETMHTTAMSLSGRKSTPTRSTESDPFAAIAKSFTERCSRLGLGGALDDAPVCKCALQTLERHNTPQSMEAALEAWRSASHEENRPVKRSRSRARCM
jgi:hypothetical protein